MRAVSSAEAVSGPEGEYEGWRARSTQFFDPALNSGNGPQGFLVEFLSPGSVVRPHFHPVRQFQVIVAGDGMLGKKALQPITFHYADPYTPYGPIVANDQGITFFTLRPELSGGVYYMPGSKEKMPGKAGRNVAGRFEIADTTAQKEPLVCETLFEPAPDGLHAVRLSLRPNAEGRGIDPQGGGGQYYLVAAGSLMYDGKELPERSLLWVEPDEPAPSLTAGPSGADLLVMQFPVNKSDAA